MGPGGVCGVGCVWGFRVNAVDGIVGFSVTSMSISDAYTCFRSVCLHWKCLILYIIYSELTKHYRKDFQPSGQ